MTEEATPIKPPMTQEQVESWIMLKGQGKDRWFTIRILDDEVGQDPTMIALMETVSDMIFAGIQDLPFQEAEVLRKKQQGKVSKAVKIEVVK